MGSQGCPTHGSAFLVDDHRTGDTICQECGRVCGQIFEGGDEQQALYDDNSRDTNGEPTLISTQSLEDDGSLPASLETYDEVDIGQVNRQDSESQSLTSSLETQTQPEAIHSLKVVVKKTAKQRRTSEAKEYIGKIADKLHFPKSLKRGAAKVFVQVRKQKKRLRKEPETHAAAALFIACQTQGVPRSFKELCGATETTSAKEIAACHQMFKTTLNLPLKPPSASQFIFRFCGRLRLSGAVRLAAIRIARVAGDMPEFGKRRAEPLAAAAAYLASQTAETRLSLQKVKTETGVSVEAIRSNYNLLLAHADALFPPNYPHADMIPKLSKYSRK